MPQEGPLVHERDVRFRLSDPGRRFATVRLHQEVRRPRDGPELEWRDGAWSTVLSRPAVDRMEYRFAAVRHDGGEEHFCDPVNPLRAQGAFGEKSVVEFPGYGPPAWLQGDVPPGGTLVELALPSSALAAATCVQLWSSRGAEDGQPRPLLVVHDGPEYRDLASLVVLLDRLVTAGRVPPLRAALLPPLDRNEHYSASGAYAHALHRDLLPALAAAAPSPPGGRVGVGTSLGALALLHAQWLRPDRFDGLYLQSGSYFRVCDRHEAGFPRFERISRFVGHALDGAATSQPRPFVLTCGTVEENLPANRAMAAALTRQGHSVQLHVNRDAHNFTAWRDTFDPHLVDLLGRVVR